MRHVSTTSVPEPPSIPDRQGTFRALRHYNYQLYFGGQIISLTGSWAQSTALTWLAWRLTHESFWTALVSAAQVLPALLLGVWGGGLADRWPRRPLIFLSQSGLLLLAILLTVLVLADRITPTGLLVVSLLIGVVNAIDTPARLTFLIDLVGRDDLLNAVALNSLVFNVARAAGPAIAGLFMTASGGLILCFSFNALTYVAVLLALLAMRLPPAVPVVDPRARGSMIDAFRYLGQHLDLVLLLFLAGAMAFFGWPVMSLLPALADHQLHAGNSGYSWMLSAIGIGALVGALAVASYGNATRRRIFLVLGVVVGVVSLVGLAFSSGLPPAILSCAFSGAGLILFFATGQATMQLGAGEHNRGRVMGIWLMVLSGAQPSGNLVAGMLADRFGVGNTLLVAASGIAISGLFAWWLASATVPPPGAGSLD